MASETLQKVTAGFDGLIKVITLYRPGRPVAKPFDSVRMTVAGSRFQ
jgi:hypothetical protein